MSEEHQAYTTARCPNMYHTLQCVSVAALIIGSESTVKQLVTLSIDLFMHIFTCVAVA